MNVLNNPPNVIWGTVSVMAGLLLVIVVLALEMYTNINWVKGAWPASIALTVAANLIYFGGLWVQERFNVIDYFP